LEGELNAISPARPGLTKTLIAVGFTVDALHHFKIDNAECVLPVLSSAFDLSKRYVDDLPREFTIEFIKEMHEHVLKYTRCTVVQTSEADQRLGLVSTGRWKLFQNSTTRLDSHIKEYCPPHLVNKEMTKFVRLLNVGYPRFPFIELHVVLTKFQKFSEQDADPFALAAWAHHTLVAIHPFQVSETNRKRS
jgi:Fic family protein